MYYELYDVVFTALHTGQSDMNFAKKGEKRKNSKFKITAERILVMVCSDVQMN